MARVMTNHIMVAMLLCGTSSETCSAGEKSASLGAPAMPTVLFDRAIFYSPPGWFDAGIKEDFHSDGTWTGIYFSRGPVGFAGRWIIKNSKICVTPDAKTIVSYWFSGARCRTVWSSPDGKILSIEHLNPSVAEGPLVVSISDLSIK